MKLSDYIVNFFEDLGVDTVFMVSGGGAQHMDDSFGRSKKIRYVCTHHEQSASMACEAYSKMKNDLCLTLVTSGPGGTNCITGVLGAYQDSVPCVFLSGQAKRSQTIANSNIEQLRQFGQQEVDIVSIVKSVTKYAVLVNDPQLIRYHLEKAVFLAKSGRPGPVWIDVPLDVQTANIDESKLLSFYSMGELPEPYLCDDDTVTELINMINDSEKPVIIAGHGIRLSGAVELFNTLIYKTHIPVVTPILGIDNMATDAPYNIGRIGTKGTRAGNFAMQYSDLVISIGCRLSVSVVGFEYELFVPNAKIVVADISKEEHAKKTIRIDRFIHCDAKDLIQKLSQASNRIDIQKHEKWACHCLNLKNKYPVCLEEYNDDSKGINYYKFVDILTKRTRAHTTIVSDAGSSFYAVSQAANIKENQRYITSGALATMGFGLPAAIGVSMATDMGDVVTVTGDGSFNQNLQELAVLKYHKLPVKVFVMNNNGYMSIRAAQMKKFKGNLVGSGTTSGLFFPDLRVIASAYQIPYLYIDSIDKLNDEIENILDSREPMLIEVKTIENQDIIPTNMTKVLEDGTLRSSSLEDMYPFLEPEELEAAMSVE